MVPFNVLALFLSLSKDWLCTPNAVVRQAHHGVGAERHGATKKGAIGMSPPRLPTSAESPPPRARPRPERVEGRAARADVVVRPSEQVRGQAGSPQVWCRAARGNKKGAIDMALLLVSSISS
jgi:hypothetical protein